MACAGQPLGHVLQQHPDMPAQMRHAEPHDRDGASNLRARQLPTASLQAVELLGMKADELAPLKEAADKDEFEALLKRCQFTQWLLRVQTRTRCADRRPCPCVLTASQ